MEKNVVSIVLYKYNVSQILKFVNRIYCNNLNCLIFLIDNSTNNNIKVFEDLKFVKYVKTKSNLGFGSGHNISIRFCIENDIKYCFVLNYDIDFDNHIFTKLLHYLKCNSKIAMIMPKLLDKNNTYQWLPKLQPTFLSVIKRKLFHISNSRLFKSFIFNYEFRKIDPEKNYNIPNLSGCFLLLNIDLVKHEALFDEKYFLYFEDYDLSRRLTSKYLTVLNNQTFVIHDYQSMANKKLLHIYFFMKSYIIFFNKWGWFNSKKLNSINKIFEVN